MRFEGDRTRKLTLQKRSVTYNDYNEEVETWNDEATIYGEKWEKQGKEADADGQIAVLQDVRFKIRYRDINEKDYRLKLGSDIYDIENKQEIGRREGWWLMCRYKDND
jgi:SPP1 family predicted phage head-tail adaptor